MSTYPATSECPIPQEYFNEVRNSIISSGVPSSLADFSGVNYVTYKPALRLQLRYVPVGFAYNSSNCFHSDRLSVSAGAQNANILGTNINVDGGEGGVWLYAKTLVFDGKTSVSMSDNQITAVRLFYTGADSNFSNAEENQVGNTINVTSGMNIDNLVFELTSTSNPNGVKLGSGKNYF